MAERFIKFIPSEEALHLARKHPNAFILLMFIAERARREKGHPDGLGAGEAHLGDWESMGLSRQNYRTALKTLFAKKFIEILETNRTRQKSTTGSTTEGTKVKILNSMIWDINLEEDNHRPNHCLTTDQPLPNHKQERRRKKKKEKEDHPSTPSNRSDRMIDDLSSKNKIEIFPGVLLTQNELDACVKIKGSVEKVKQAMEFIQSSKRRKHEIADWPNALARWKIENTGKVRIEENVAFAERLCQEFADFKNGRGWRCSLYVDKERDQRGVLFENQGFYQKAFFVALVDGEIHKKCEDFITEKKMRKK